MDSYSPRIRCNRSSAQKQKSPNPKDLLVTWQIIMDHTDQISTQWKLALELSQPNEFVKSSCPENDQVDGLKPWEVTNGSTTRYVLVYIPPKLCTTLVSDDTPEAKSLRVLLAIHGYGGQPMHEIKKWHDTAVDLQSIIISPKGTPTESNGRLGWNANDCCGDPVANNVNDLDFLYGLVDAILNDGMKRKNQVNIIATGFSNGGFMSSLIGLQTVRLPNLVGIVPTGGYQYDLNLYDDLQNESLPLPMFAHHGGKDGVIQPDGCCNSVESSLPIEQWKSNCPMDIGINQSTCTSLQTMFEKWSQINQCKSTSVDESISTNGDRQLTDDSPDPRTCWKGNECQAPTALCIWTNAGHNWGWQFPGVMLTKTWMDNVFTSAETNTVPITAATASEVEYNGTQTFLLVAAMIIFCIMLIRFMVVKYRSRLGLAKRKTSEDSVVSIEITTS